ncbi:AlwI family type II restriction endonuclease [Lactobacillus sp. Sy-1]|uniref:AlwI family type II restriction endonuclease n=1 Tax=Lactobacillus sp. Sy-1 TaxID=2109645 RepID=UPI001C5A9DFA|nr:AlwI family type II restriction endonuclease [Lactobacillus sp. Sy-1]MBW1606459.1 AlwI family type II restriction endonuclease [Lactobacillus sp. Sy-1]
MVRRFSRKALLLATAVRNPERFPAFLSALFPYDGELFTESVARKIAVSLIQSREYYPDKAIKNVDELHKYIKNTKPMTLDDAETAMQWNLDNLSGHGVGGFPKKSWGGRAVEWFNLMQELGAVRVHKDSKIQFSKSGNDLVRIHSDSLVKNPDILLSNFWLNGLVKLQPKSPFRSGTIENRPFVLMLDVMIKLSKKLGINYHGLYRHELSFLLNWNGYDADEFIDYILSVRKRYGLQPSSDVVYELVMNDKKMLYGESQNRFKKAQIIYDIVNDWMGKTRMTGIIQSRGNGRALDIITNKENSNDTEEMDKAKYIVAHYHNYNDETDPDKYFDYIAQVDNQLLFSESKSFTDHTTSKKDKLSELSQSMSWDEITKELNVLSSNRSTSKNEMLKIIREPLRFEFLSAIAAKKAFSNAKIEANYPADDEGMPRSTAPGGVPDLFIKDDKTGTTIEVTLQNGKQQAVNEIPAIDLHLKDMKERDHNNNYFAVFVAQRLHEQTIWMSEFSFANGDIISTYDIKEYASAISRSREIDDLKKLPKVHYKRIN